MPGNSYLKSPRSKVGLQINTIDYEFSQFQDGELCCVRTWQFQPVG